jgi:uncharacterized RDD family membrane protein YckC
MEGTPSPYRAPQSSLADPDDAVHLEVASRGSRLANLLIDYVIFILLLFVITFALVFIMSEEAFDRYSTSLLADLSGLLILSVYYIACEGVWGRTVGKLVTGTKVVDEHSKPPGWSKVVGRTLSRLIPFEPFSVFGERRLCWHDSLAGTKVVRCR